MVDATLFLQQHDCPGKRIEFRRCVRRVARILTTVADQNRFASGVVTNISEGGCELQDVGCDWSPISFFPSQYLTLRLYPLDEPAALQITLAEIRWVEGELAGVEFVSVSQGDKAKLKRLCSTYAALTLGDTMPTGPEDLGIAVADDLPSNLSNSYPQEVW